MVVCRLSRCPWATPEACRRAWSLNSALFVYRLRLATQSFLLRIGKLALRMRALKRLQELCLLTLMARVLSLWQRTLRLPAFPRTSC